MLGVSLDRKIAWVTGGSRGIGRATCLALADAGADVALSYRAQASAANKGGRGQSNYAASKGAVEALSRSLAVELAKRNITVNCVAPGVIETDMSAEVRKLAESEIMDRQLIKRYGKPEEVAAWIVFL